MRPIRATKAISNCLTLGRSDVSFCFLVGTCDVPTKERAGGLSGEPELYYDYTILRTQEVEWTVNDLIIRPQSVH